MPGSGAESPHFGLHRRSSTPKTFDQTIQELIDQWPPCDLAATKQALLDTLKVEEEPVVFEQAAELLIESTQIRDLLGVELVDAFLARATPSNEARDAYMASIALAGAASVLLVEDLGGRRLNAALLLRDAPDEVDVAWAQSAVSFAGLAYAHWQEPTLRQASLTALERIAKHANAGSDAEAELGYVKLFDAVSASTPSELEEGLEASEALFGAAARRDEERVDANLMSKVVAAVRGFGFGGDPEKIDAEAHAALDLWRERGMYGRPNALPGTARRAAEAAWGKLIAMLAETGALLDGSIWTHGAKAVGLLLDAVEAAAAVPGMPGTSGADGVILPRIESSLARNLWQRQMIASVLDEEEIEEQRREAATQLLGRTSKAVVADGGSPTLEVLTNDLEPLRTALGDAAFQKLRERAQLRVCARSRQNRDGQWVETYDSLLEALAGFPDFESDWKQDISDLLGDLLDFVKRCLQSQLNFSGGLLGYLGDPNAQESEMADHLHSHLEDIADWSVNSEVPNEGSGGRVDLRVAMGADRFVIECKRDASPISKETVGEYLAQTERYLGVSLRIAALVVLDLTPKDTGPAPTLDSCAWVSEIPPTTPGSGSSRKVVCFVVPGNRAVTPSQAGRKAGRKAR